MEQARCLHDYATHAEACGDSFVRSSTVLDWASTTPSPRQAQVKLRYVCDLASVLHADDERHEVPDRDALGKARSRRPSPHLLSLTEIRQIMDAALELAPAGSITPLTFHCILGQIAATGLRRSEATGLLLTGLTADGLLIGMRSSASAASSRWMAASIGPWMRISGRGSAAAGPTNTCSCSRRAGPCTRSISRPSSSNWHGGSGSEPGQASLGRAFMTFVTHPQFARSNVPITAARADRLAGSPRWSGRPAHRPAHPRSGSRG